MAGPSQPILAVLGPTASGKTALALALAKRLGGEVISADSRQVYRGLDAGTAKPPLDAAGRSEGIPYHLVDRADISETFDAGRFANEAGRLVDEIRGRDRLPIVAGGTGLYVRALFEGLADIPKADPEVRRKLAGEALRRGRDWLHRRLAVVDPAAAAKIPANNVQRLIRALEVHELTGRPISELWASPRRGGVGGEPLALRIDWPAEELKGRITERAGLMWPAILAETSALLASGLRGTEAGFKSLGYPEALRCLAGEVSSAEGLALLAKATLAYAKRQRTWFRGQVQAVPIPGGPLEDMLAAALAAARARGIAERA